MRFVELNLLGVYVAPISVLMVVAWLITIALRRIAVRLGVWRHVWHPALFVASIYTIVLSSLVLIAAR
jgi:protein AaeX